MYSILAIELLILGIVFFTIKNISISVIAATIVGVFIAVTIMSYLDKLPDMIITYKTFNSLFESTESEKWIFNFLTAEYLADAPNIRKRNHYGANYVVLGFKSIFDYVPYWLFLVNYTISKHKEEKLKVQLEATKIFQNEISKREEKGREQIRQGIEDVKEIMDTPVPNTFELTLEGLEDKYKEEKSIPEETKKGTYFGILTNNIDTLNTCKELTDYVSKKYDEISAPYPVIEVVNYMLELAWDKEKSEHLWQATKRYQLGVVLYLLQLVYINRYGKSLFKENIEVNQYGPMVSKLSDYNLYEIWNHPKDTYIYYPTHEKIEIKHCLKEEDKAFIYEWWVEILGETAISFHDLRKLVFTHDIIKKYAKLCENGNFRHHLSWHEIQQEGKELAAAKGMKTL